MIDMGLRPDAAASARAVTAGYKVDISRGDRIGCVGIDLLSWTVGGLAGLGVTRRSVRASPWFGRSWAIGSPALNAGGRDCPSLRCSQSTRSSFGLGRRSRDGAVRLTLWVSALDAGGAKLHSVRGMPDR